MPSDGPMMSEQSKGSKNKLLIDVITGASLKRKDAVNIEYLRPSLVEYIGQVAMPLPAEGYISRKALEEFRGRYISQLLREERGELTNLENEVIESLKDHDTLAENIEDDYEDSRSLGDRVADIVASFGGSWTFIISFCLFLAVWMAINLIMGADKAFDAYPFILLNLVLSTIAALQAPVIMMSQRRQEQKDRLRALNDYKVNLKAELEIRHLHEKVDHLLNRQWERLTEIQQIQIEMMRDQAKKTERALKIVKRPKPSTKAKKPSSVAPGAASTTPDEGDN
ncbi:DUF1003 domain-containing protein [Rhizobium oryzicola]|uniref:DUF1003 domain-containing protein n=1 Tax=Rhizobium oryzicola TaxID=1232668 RepID=A0ABT8STA7_9HYPH|nr:DUF1003 domain-containing protein [Rhizobium oryzicola]MDO1581329.1 DUF1003 domain-containing protein [Rhizobium oryzicola]